VAPHGDDAVLFDAEGLSRVCGPPEVIVREVEVLARAQGLTVRVALSDTMTSAWVLAQARAGLTVVAPGRASEALATVPIGWLGSVFELDRAVRQAERHRVQPASDTDVTPRRGRRSRGHYRVAPPPAPRVSRTHDPQSSADAPADRRVVAECRDRLATFARWGIRTCGDLAALVRADIQTRMGPVGVRLHQAACGEDVVPLVPVDEPRVFADRVVLEWPIEGLEPLAFVLARQCDRLSDALERADRGAVVIHTVLTLVTRDTHARSLSLPAPLRDARVLRTLILLDLESHPPSAGIDVVEIRLDVTPGRILQGSLLSLAVPTPEDLSTLLARLGALMGEARIGAPVRLDSHDARQIALVPFQIPVSPPAPQNPAPSHPVTQHPASSTAVVSSSLRRFRLPLAARVTVEHGTPVRVYLSTRDLRGGAVVTCAGPWRSSGGWWTAGRAAWDRDEWDVELADGVTYRLVRLRGSGAWEIEGVFD
jgi:protein ImuB